MATGKTLTKAQLAKAFGPGGDEKLMRLDLVGAAEAAELILGVERARIGKWRRNGILLGSGERIDFPEPIHVAITCAADGDTSKLAATPLWWADDIRELANRIHGSKIKD